MMMTVDIKTEINVEIVNDIPSHVVEYVAKCYHKNDFSTLEKIGEGGFGSVYKLGDYAIKFIHDPNEYGNNDANVLKDICHLESIPTLYAVIEDSVIIVDRVDGMTVLDYSHKDSNPYGLTRESIERWNQTLDEIVRLGYSPYDLHEENVMVDKNGNVKIVDVGFFKKHHGDDTYTKEKDRGYRKAQSWAGAYLRNYMDRIEEKAMEREMAVDFKFMEV